MESFHFKPNTQVNIQITHFHKLFTYCLRTNLIPISLCQTLHTYKAERRRLEFYGSGYIKERLAHKIVLSFEICSPNVLTNLRSSILKLRSEVFDLLHLNEYFPHTSEADKATVINLIIAECGIRKNMWNLPLESRLILEEIEIFLINVLFLNGCKLYYQSPLKMSVSHYRQRLYNKTKKKTPMDVDYNIAPLFDIEIEEIQGE
ncbi:Uncharacterized protein QTN25_006353 [Entamoeba marina]